MIRCKLLHRDKNTPKFGILNDFRSISLKNKLLLLLVPATLSATVVFWLWKEYPDVESWKALYQSTSLWMEAHPIILILALMILPGLGFPLSILLVAFGGIIGPQYGLPAACLIAITTQAICSTWTYLLASGPLRGFLRKHILRDRALPELVGGNALRIGFIVRVTPGVPYALQNIALGVIGLKLRDYLIVSIPIQSLYVIGFVVTGGAIFQGKAGLAITGALLLVILIIITRMILSKRKVKDDR